MFIDPRKIHILILLAFYGYIMKVEAPLMLKMVLQYEFGQLVFKWFTFTKNFTLTQTQRLLSAFSARSPHAFFAPVLHAINDSIFNRLT